MENPPTSTTVFITTLQFRVISLFQKQWKVYIYIFVLLLGGKHMQQDLKQPIVTRQLVISKEDQHSETRNTRK